MVEVYALERGQTGERTCFDLGQRTRQRDALECGVPKRAAADDLQSLRQVDLRQRGAAAERRRLDLPEGSRKAYMRQRGTAHKQRVVQARDRRLNVHAGKVRVVLDTAQNTYHIISFHHSKLRTPG